MKKAGFLAIFLTTFIFAAPPRFIRPRKIAGESAVIATRGAWAKNPGIKRSGRIAKRASLDGEFFGRLRGGVWTNETYGLEMSLPSGWYLTSAPEVFEQMVAAGMETTSARMDAREMMKKVGFLVMISEHPFGRPDNTNLVVGVEELPRPMSSEEYSRAAMEALTLAIPLLKVLKPPESIPLAEESVVRFEALTPVEGGGPSVRQRFYMLVRDRRAFIFSFSSSEERFDEYEAALQKTVSSLRFLKP